MQAKVIKCANCGTENSPDSHSCYYCGRTLKGSPTVILEAPKLLGITATPQENPKKESKVEPVAPKRKRQRKKWNSNLVGLALIAIIGFLWQPIANQITINTAEPALTALANSAGMSRKGMLLFLHNHPKLDTPSELAADCPKAATEFSVQGCYDPSTSSIYILQMPTA